MSISRKVGVALAILALLVTALVFLALRDNPARVALGAEKTVDTAAGVVQYFLGANPSRNDGERVVLLASYARSVSDFNELVEVLNREGYQTLAMQMRGVGGSTLRPIASSLFDYAEDLAAVLDAEGWQEPVVIVGHAYGNRVARSFSSRYPGRVKSLVLLAAGDSAPPDQTRDDISKVVFQLLPDSTRHDALRRAFFAPENLPPASWLGGWYPMAGMAQAYATANTPRESWTGAGNAHMLVVQPEHDAAARHGASALKARHPDRVAVIPLAGAGHAVLPEKPERIAQIILDHLSGR